MSSSETKENMSARKHAFILFGLLFLSTAFFVSAQDNMSGSNIVDDPDHDGLTTEEEKLYGTDPMNSDTDGDGYTDGVEVKGGYNPLKQAPGDKIIPEATSADTTGAKSDSPVTASESLTDKLSTEIASVIQNADTNQDGNTEVTLDKLNSISQEVLSGNMDNVVLPDVDMSRIKVMEQKYDKYSKDKKDEKIRQDIIEYLTVLGYIFGNNFPKKFTTQDELQVLSDGMVSNVISALSFGNFSEMTSLVKDGDKILEQVYDVKVPPQMLDVHVKAVKLALYASQLGGELNSSGSNQDPIKTISSLSKMQGLLNVVSAFILEARMKLSEYNITDIPIEL